MERDLLINILTWAPAFAGKGRRFQRGHRGQALFVFVGSRIVFCRAAAGNYEHPHERAYAQLLARNRLPAPPEFLAPAFKGPRIEGLETVEKRFQFEPAPIAILTGRAARR